MTTHPARLSDPPETADQLASRVQVTPAALQLLPGKHDFATRARQRGLDVCGPLVHGPLTVDLEAYSVLLRGTPLALSPRQVELLAVFLAAPGRVWSRAELHGLCWGDTPVTRSVDAQLCRLRTLSGLSLFRNARGRGWVLAPRAAAALPGA